MIIYKDLLNGDELLSDSYDMKEVQGAVYEVQCKKINVGGEAINIGGNPSAEGGDDEGTDDASSAVLDIVHSFRLQEYGPLQSKQEGGKTITPKKQLAGILKDYFGAVKKKMREDGKSEEDVKAFESKAAPYAKELLNTADDITFYMGESMEPNAMLIPFRWRGEEHDPYAAFWIHGMKEEKV